MGWLTSTELSAGPVRLDKFENNDASHMRVDIVESKSSDALVGVYSKNVALGIRVSAKNGIDFVCMSRK